MPGRERADEWDSIGRFGEVEQDRPHSLGRDLDFNPGCDFVHHRSSFPVQAYAEFVALNLLPLDFGCASANHGLSEQVTRSASFGMVRNREYSSAPATMAFATITGTALIAIPQKIQRHGADAWIFLSVADRFTRYDATNRAVASHPSPLVVITFPSRTRSHSF